VKYIRQAAVIFVVTFAGEVLHYLLPLPVPAGIYGLVLLFLLLLTGLLPVSAVRETGLFLVEIMPLMFIPAAVALLDSWELFAGRALSYAVLTVVSTFAVMALSGQVTQHMLKREPETEMGTETEAAHRAGKKSRVKKVKVA